MYRPGEIISGFEILSVSDLPEYKGTGIRCRHIKTGCEIYHLHNDDRENLFSFIFKTPSEDNTGAAHILEHCVLAGSRKYPLKDPFLSMMNGSMNTFLNAMTYPDKTVYPAASTVEKDYFNLMSVYGDAVFFPLLKEETFMQEGVRFEPSGGGFETGGVVFNEMKGAYSNHDSIAGEYSYRMLFPDTPYRYDSGGEPLFIPELDYNAFRAFHEKHYHPSNCRIFLYGNIGTERQLAFIEENFLSGFDGPGLKAADIPFQRNWSAAVRETVSCPDSSEDGDSSVSILLNWKMASPEDPVELLSLNVLTEALLGNMGAPLYKAVVESDLGEDLSPVSGLESDLREMVFSVGIRGAAEGDAEAFEELIFSVLNGLAGNGIPEDSIKGALHHVEFSNREIRGGAPFGLRLMERALKGWLHGENPETTMVYEEPMAELKRRMSEDPRYMEKMISKWLLDNTHRLTLTVVPDEAYYDDFDSVLEAKITEICRGRELKLSEAAGRFLDFQKTPDTPEALAAIPTLELEDLPREIRRISTTCASLAGVPLYYHDLFTNGIVYYDFAIDVSDISGEQAMLLPFLSRMICSSGLPGVPYDEVAIRLAVKTGGLFTFLESSRLADGSGEYRDYLFFRVKSLEKDLPEAAELVGDLFINSCIDDEDRVRDLLLEMRNDFRSSVIPSGHSHCAVVAGAQLDRAFTRENEWRGAAQLQYLTNLTADIDKRIPGLCSMLKQLREQIFNGSRLCLNITCGADCFTDARDNLEKIAKRFPEGTAPARPERGVEIVPSLRQASLAVPSSVGFSATVFRSSDLSAPEHARESLVAHLLKTTYLWEEVRMKNGAYGVNTSVNGTEGLFTYSTYRNPALAESIDILEKAFGQVAEYTEEDLKKAIITVVGKDARPLSPGEESLIGFRRELYRITDDLRQRKREAMLSCSVGDLVSAAAGLGSRLRDSGVTVVMASEAVIKEIAAEHGSGYIDNMRKLNL